VIENEILFKVLYYFNIVTQSQGTNLGSKVCALPFNPWCHSTVVFHSVEKRISLFLSLGNDQANRNTFTIWHSIFLILFGISQTFTLWFFKTNNQSHGITFC